MPITVHCLVKNEEVFVGYAIKSVIDFVDNVLVFDTGSTDSTVSIIQSLQKEYPQKIVFEQKGPCDKIRHTALRQEMIDCTTTDWFMILDGDEVWTRKGMEEVTSVIKNNISMECVMAPFYLCVGDIYHHTRKKGRIDMIGRKDFWYPRVIKKARGVHWVGDYNEDTLRDESEEIFFNAQNSITLQNRFWHMTHLRRSSMDDSDYSSGGSRSNKRVLSYFLIGKKIPENIPEVFLNFLGAKMTFCDSVYNLFSLVFKKPLDKFRHIK